MEGGGRPADLSCHPEAAPAAPRAAPHAAGSVSLGSAADREGEEGAVESSPAPPDEHRAGVPEAAAGSEAAAEAAAG